MAKKRKSRKNPAVDAAQYRLAQAVAHGTARTRTRMSKRVARELIAKTPAKKRSQFSKHNPAKRNPEALAENAYREFHGKDPEVVIEVETPFRYHSVLAGMARLKYFDVARQSDGKNVHIKFGKDVYLTENEARNQLFVTGGDQSVDVRLFGVSVPHEYQVLGKVTGIGYYTEKKHLIEKDGGKGTYGHPFGYTRKGNREVRVSKSDPPTLIYDVRNKLMTLAGGSYTIKAEGIDG